LTDTSQIVGPGIFDAEERSTSLMQRDGDSGRGGGSERDR